MTAQKQPDSQAGDELDTTLEELSRRTYTATYRVFHQDNLTSSGMNRAITKAKQKAKADIEAYTERLATKRAIEEARLWKYHIDRAEDSEASSMFLDTRIKELAATLTKESDNG